MRCSDATRLNGLSEDFPKMREPHGFSPFGLFLLYKPFILKPSDNSTVIIFDNRILGIALTPLDDG